MIAPLYEVKNKLSEFVSSAERGETISITKHGKTVAYILGANSYEKKMNNFPSFSESLAAWDKKWTSDIKNADDNTPWDNIRSKEFYEDKKIWAD